MPNLLLPALGRWVSPSGSQLPCIPSLACIPHVSCELSTGLLAAHSFLPSLPPLLNFGLWSCPLVIPQNLNSLAAPGQHSLGKAEMLSGPCSLLPSTLKLQIRNEFTRALDSP